MPHYKARVLGEFELATPEGEFYFETDRILNIEAPDYEKALILATNHINYQSKHLTTILESLVLV